MNKIVALVGMCGSGKSVCCEQFQKKGWDYVYFGSVTMNELQKRGLEKCEKNERLVREDIRKKYGPAAFAILLKPIIEEKLKNNNVCLDGLYSWSEYKVLSEAFKDSFTVAAIITPRKLRYERISKRDIRPLTFEEALSRDTSEIENMEKGGPIAMADIFIMNDSTLDDYIKNIDKAIDSVL